MNLFDIGSIISSVGKVADDLFTSDEERLKVALQEKIVDVSLIKGQQEINIAEAKSGSLFVAGWRPFIGWIGGIGLAYQFLLYPLLVWIWSYLGANNVIPANLAPPPPMHTDQLWVLLSGMLGMGGLRSYDKVKNVQTNQVQVGRVRTADK